MFVFKPRCILQPGILKDISCLVKKPISQPGILKDISCVVKKPVLGFATFSFFKPHHWNTCKRQQSSDQTPHSL